MPPARVRDERLAFVARALRRANRSISCEAAREVLCQGFGETVGASDTWLKRQWSAAGLGHQRPAAVDTVAEEVVVLHGGPGLASLAVADAEVGASRSLARAIPVAGAEAADKEPAQTATREEAEGTRDANGRFLPTYNAQWQKDHAPGARDQRWLGDDAKRSAHVLGDLPLLNHRPETLANQLLCMAHLRGIAVVTLSRAR